MRKSIGANEHLKRLRGWRTYADKDCSLKFLSAGFKKAVERPYKQVAAVVELWEAMVPDELLKHTRLEGMKMGVLRVGVDSSVRMYELDRLLRGGLENEMRRVNPACGLRKVELKLVGGV